MSTCQHNVDILTGWQVTAFPCCFQWHVTMSTRCWYFDRVTSHCISLLFAVTCHHVNMMLICWHGDKSLHFLAVCSDISPCQHVNMMLTCWHVDMSLTYHHVNMSTRCWHVDMLTCHCISLLLSWIKCLTMDQLIQPKHVAWHFIDNIMCSDKMLLIIYRLSYNRRWRVLLR